MMTNVLDIHGECMGSKRVIHKYFLIRNTLVNVDLNHCFDLEEFVPLYGFISML